MKVYTCCCKIFKGFSFFLDTLYIDLEYTSSVTVLYLHTSVLLLLLLLLLLQLLLLLLLRLRLLLGCAICCVVECQICNREVAGSNLSLGYFAPRSTQPSIHPGSVNEYQLRLGRQRQVWLIPIADECEGVQVKLWNSLRTRAIPERFCGDDSLYEEALILSTARSRFGQVSRASSKEETMENAECWC